MKLLRKLKKLVTGVADIYWFPHHGSFHTEEDRLTRLYYKNSAEGNHFQPGVVMMVDGRTMHGGMSDRLRGIASVYGYCRERGIPFYIHHTYPFRLDDYLEPAAVKWQIDDADVSYCNKNARPVVLMLHLIPSKLHRIYLNHLFKNDAWKHRQFHVYSNTLLTDKQYSRNFNELFRPADRLDKAVEHECSEMGAEGFIAVVLRFQQLLGDFEEGDYKVLPENERQLLVEKCLQQVDGIYQRHGGNGKVLVTSDSTTFLQAAKKRFPYVHIISGRMVHMDYTDDADYQTYMKSFVDMLTLSHASKIYLLRTGDMYKSGFAYRAAAINDVPYEYVEF